jgi:hypothetical protein
MSDNSDYWTLLHGLLSAARDNCAKEYDDLFRTFASLDAKAQNTAAIAGVQLAAILAFLQKDNLRILVESYGPGTYPLLIATLITLVVVIGACMLAMKVTDLPEPYSGVREVEALASLRRLPSEEFDAETTVNHLVDHLEMWKGVIKGMSDATYTKATSVKACQWTMVLGLAGASMVFLLLVLALWA